MVSCVLSDVARSGVTYMIDRRGPLPFVVVAAAVLFLLSITAPAGGGSLTGPTQTQTTNTSPIAPAGSWILQRNPVAFPVAVAGAAEGTGSIPDSGGRDVA